MVPPEELEKTQPTTLPADFSEWDGGKAHAAQPANFNGFEAVPRSAAVPKPSARPATARVAVLPVVDRLPNAASRTPATAHAGAEQVFQPRRSKGVNMGGLEHGVESKDKHKRTGTFAAVGSLALLLILGSLGYFELRPKTVVVKPSVVPQPTTTNTPLTTATDASAPKPTPATAATATTTEPERPLTTQSQMMNNQLSAPSRISNDLKLLAGGKEAPPSSGFGAAGAESLGNSGNVFAGQTGPKVRIEASRKMISAGVAGGLLIQKAAPVYPQIAKQARISGTVVIQATISKTGSILNLRAVSGPTMLRQAALDAVKTWRYRPYILDNEPVEVETTVSVTFAPAG